LGRFAEKVKAEALEQRRLRAAGEAIPPDKRLYARKAGLGAALVTGAGALVIVVLGFLFDSLYYGVALFLIVLGGIGALQFITGRHILTGRG